MARCDFCHSSILFGGVREGTLRFCNENCNNQSLMVSVADEVPPEVLQQHINEIHQGECPRCNGPGPIDVHVSHTIWSALVLTSWQSHPQICCRSCGVKAKLGSAAISGIVGWWGIPWGLIGTPIQVLRNLVGIATPPNPSKPSETLTNIIKLQLGQNIMQHATSAESSEHR